MTEGTYRFTLQVLGKGTSRAAKRLGRPRLVRVGPGTSAAPVLQSSTVNGATLTLTYDKDLKKRSARTGRQKRGGVRRARERRDDAQHTPRAHLGRARERSARSP